MDLVTHLPKTRKKRNTALVVMVDKLSKMVHIAPCKTKVSAVEVAEIFYREVVRYHGVPMSVVSDRDPRFVSNFWRSLWALLGTKLKMSTAYHPQTDGQTENTNKIIETMIRGYVNDRLNDWDEHLIEVEIAINKSVQASTGYSPFYLNSGQEPNFPLGVAASRVERGEGVNESVNRWVRRVASDLDKAKENLVKAQQRQQKHADKHRRPVQYQVGDQVLLTTENLSSHNSKLRAKFVGPFRVVRVLSDVVVELDLPPEMSRRHKKFHVEKLKPWRGDKEKFPTRTQRNRPVAELVEEQEPEYIVDRIVDERVVNGRQQYLVRWEGRPESESTWQSPAELVSALGKVEEWKRRNEGREREDEDEEVFMERMERKYEPEEEPDPVEEKEEEEEDDDGVVVLRRGERGQEEKEREEKGQERNEEQNADNQYQYWLDADEMREAEMEENKEQEQEEEEQLQGSAEEKEEESDEEERPRRSGRQRVQAWVYNPHEYGRKERG